MNESEFNYFVTLLKEKAGWQISDSDLFLFSSKLDNVMRKYNIMDVGTLISEMKKSPKVFLWQVIEALAPLNTSFYRNYRVVRAMENILFPYLLDNNYSTKRIKILCLGCSTGQEVYSIAMSIKKKIKDYKKWDIQLLGVDISSDAILKAQKGYYSQFEIQHGLNAKDIIENFKKVEGYWQANQDLLDMVQFRRENIIFDDKSSEKYDLIFCRNVLNNFTVEMQKKVIESVYEHQGDGGFLFLGLGERISGLDDYYSASDMECIYKVEYKSKKAGKAVSSIEPDMPTFQRPKKIRINNKILEI